MVEFITLQDGRKVTYAEIGDPQGKPVFFFHGMPGCRLIVHPDESIVVSLGIRLIAPDRPGMGGSDYQPRRRLLDYPSDVLELADALGFQTFSVMGFSGGGPYAVACGYRIPQRLRTVGILSGIGPLDTPGVLEGMLPSNRMGYTVGRWMPWRLWRIIFNLYYGKVRLHPELLARMTKDEPESDRQIFLSLGVENMHKRGFTEAFHQGTDGAAWEGWLMSRPWGFRLEDIRTKVYLWQGEADVVVTPAMGRVMASRIPNCQAMFLPDEGHLLYIKHWREILITLSNWSFWSG